MMEADSPFITKLFQTYVSNTMVYFLEEPSLGGDFFERLQLNKFPMAESDARFYIACVVSAIEHLHSLGTFFFQHEGIIYRDLKPENLLIDHKGYVKLADFGFSKKILDNDSFSKSTRFRRTKSFCGTDHYLSPEIIKGKKYDVCADLWALGILSYEIIYGAPCFYYPASAHSDEYSRILSSPIDFPASGSISHLCKDFITRLCHKDPKKRLGIIPELKSVEDGSVLPRDLFVQGIEEVKQHEFFKDFPWKKLTNREIVPPWVPDLDGPYDLKFFSQDSQPLVGTKVSRKISFSKPHTLPPFLDSFAERRLMDADELQHHCKEAVKLQGQLLQSYWKSFPPCGNDEADIFNADTSMSSLISFFNDETRSRKGKKKVYSEFDEIMGLFKPKKKKASRLNFKI